MKVSGDAGAPDKIVISGSKAQDEFATLEAQVNVHRQKVMALWQQADSLKKEADKQYKYESEIRKQFILAHPNSVVSLQELLNWTNDANYKEAKTIFAGLDAALQKPPRVRRSRCAWRTSTK